MKVEVEDNTEIIMTDAIMISEVIRINIDQIVEIGDNIDRTEVGLGINKFKERKFQRSHEEF